MVLSFFSVLLSLPAVFLTATGPTQLFALAAPSTTKPKCHASLFGFPNITDATLSSITAEPLFNYTGFSLLPGTDVGGKYSVDFCNVTVAYGHVGWRDLIHVSVWLPLQGWNERVLGLGGGGYSATFGSVYHTAAVAEGFVAFGTDAGHTAGLSSSSDPSSWTITSTGNSNYYLLEDFGSRSLGELSTIGKHITRNFYGRLPQSSYFTGCSGGGRQAFALAQRYPNAFDGLLASSPAISIESAIPAAFYAAQLMNVYDHYPSPCEIKAFTEAAVSACDNLDGVEDNIISAPEYCTFSPHDVVGQRYTCNTTEYYFTNKSAMIVEAAWTGPSRNGVFWYPYNKDADLTGAVITTECEGGSNNCTRTAATSVASGGLSPSGGSSGNDLLGTWFQYFLAKDAEFDVDTMTMDEFYRYLHQSQAEWAQMLGAADPLLDGFKSAGGKMISWHGLADNILPPGGTSAYYDQVLQVNEQATDFYRHFEAPGVGHCYGGNGPLPNAALRSLMAWVENGTAPDTLLASSAATGIERPLCPYPSRQIYAVGDPNVSESFACTPSELM